MGGGIDNKYLVYQLLSDDCLSSWTRSPPLLCPTPASPYLATRLNSGAADPGTMADMEEDYRDYMHTVRQFNIDCYM